MRLVLLNLVLCVSALAAGPRNVTQPEVSNKLPSRSKASKRKRAFHPLGLLRRLGNAESELALRLSSCGIPRPAESAEPPGRTAPAQSELASDPRRPTEDEFP
jgi:hypothetical protein